MMSVYEMSTPTYSVNVSYLPHGLFKTITLKPVHRGGQIYNDYSVLRAAAATMKSQVMFYSRRGLGWGDDKIRNNVYGYVTGINVNSDGGRHITSHPIRIKEINIDLFTSLLKLIHESNMDLSVWDIEWEYHIQRDSIFAGGDAKNGLKPSWLPANVYPHSWDEQTLDGKEINCLAFCLATRVICDPLKDKRIRTEKRLLSIKKRAVRFMDDYDWYGYVSPAHLYKFVDEYPTYRVTVLFEKLSDHSDFTYVGDDWLWTESDEKTIYIHYGILTMHYGLIKSPQEFFSCCNESYNRRTYYSWCTKCQLRSKRYDNHECGVEISETRNTKRYKKECAYCGQYGPHTCFMKTCRTCSVKYKSDINSPHRCILYLDPERDESQQFIIDNDPEFAGKRYKLYAYDFESMMVKMTNTETIEFVTDENGEYVIDPETMKVETITVEKNMHKVNFVAFWDVHDSNSGIMKFSGDDALTDFIRFMTSGSNKGKNICVAHNASGYDTRLLWDESVKIIEEGITFLPITRGTKFMQLNIGKTRFIDSMLHLKGSLKSLATSFLGKSANMRKGFFCHLFNTIENRNYVGPIPDKKYFDITTIAKSKADVDEFNEWHDSYNGEWDFQKELAAYCENDVEILGKLMKEYDDILISKFNMSAWFKSTSPSYVHELFLRKLCNELNLSDDPTERSDQIAELSKSGFWAVLVSNEYWFARCGLRGGRTEIRKIYHHVSDEDYENGIRIRYQDVTSLYPYVQIVKEYPVGTPIIEIYDDDYYPCYAHRNRLEPRCKCVLSFKLRKPDTRLDIVMKDRQLTVDEILDDDSFFGVVCATLIPPKDLFHPVLVMWDDKVGKSVATLDPIIGGVFTSVEFKVALKHKYQLVKLHRLDRYNKKPSLWASTLKELYIDKMANSSKNPTPEEQEIIIDKYERGFGMGQAVRDSFPWSKNPAKKQTAKIQLNSGWGKHAERPVMPEIKVFDDSQDAEISAMFQNLAGDKHTVLDIIDLPKSRTMFKYKISENVDPDFHKGYLPASIFVPAYGRLMLWEQLNELKERVLMHDTDSIIYVYDPDKYNIPVGDVLGEWSVEDIDSEHGGIRSFVGLCPKSYALKANDGKEMVKIKGLSLKYATRNMVNFDVCKQLVEEYLNKSDTKTVKSLPQMTFSYRFNHEMSTRYHFKDLSFKPNDLKGNLDENGVLYPYGWMK